MISYGPVYIDFAVINIVVHVNHRLRGIAAVAASEVVCHHESVPHNRDMGLLAGKNIITKLLIKTF